MSEDFAVRYPMPGIQVWTNQYGIDIFRLHYSADPDKDERWAEEEHRRCTSEAMWRQEYEIDFGATMGAFIWDFDESITLEDDFLIPAEWTRYFALDPHPVVPHAGLWVAVDPWGDLWCYRELWPSKVCFRYQGTRKLGAPGNVPEEDNHVTIREWVEVLQWLESARNPENSGRDERIYSRVIDYACRAFGQGTTDDPDQPNFQQRFATVGRELGVDLYFEDAKKDHETGHEMVNALLRGRLVDDGKNGFHKKSRLHILRHRCPELIYQIKNYRRAALTPAQMETKDPQFKPIQKRNHLCDCLRYVVMAKPEYVNHGGRAYQSSFRPGRVGGR